MIIDFPLSKPLHFGPGSKIYLNSDLNFIDSIRFIII